MRPFAPKKQLGQHFLIDEAVIHTLVAAAHPQPQDFFIEIGPGKGALTEALVPLVQHLSVIEIDKTLCAYLQKKFKAAANLHIYHQDVLKFEFMPFLENPVNTHPLNHKVRMMGNLPYNISTPCLFYLLNFTAHISDMHFMLQQEVVDRITAIPDCKAYGRLSIMIQYFCKTEYLFSIEKESFKPPPKVRSAVVRLRPFAELPFPALDFDLFKKFVTHVFTKRRKTLLNAAKPYLLAEDFKALQLDPQLRAEQLEVKTYVEMANYLTKKGIC